MKTLLTSFILLFCCLFLFGNPIVEHINITEFKFTDTGWQMELYSEFFGSTNMDSCYISCSNGSSYFQPGIPYLGFELIVVTQDDLITPLEVNAEGDSVAIHYLLGEGSSFDFGSLENMVLAPSEGQSLRSVGLSLNALDTYFVFAKDNTPSIGTGDDGFGFTGTFCGYVFDSLMNPVVNVEIEHTPDCISIPDIITNENGHFEVELYAFNYHCNIHLGALASMDSIISIEPDSLNYYEFIFENYVHSDDYEIELPASFYQLSNHPNPFNPSTTISFSLTTEITEGTESAEIQIFNSRGQKVKTLDCCNSFAANARDSRSTYSVIWNGDDNNGNPVASGVYFYKLVSGDKELAANKMLLLR